MPSRTAATLILASAIWAVALLLLAVRYGYELERDIWLLQGTGWTAAAALCLTLAMSPLAHMMERLGRSPARLMALRRLLGITCASWGLAHAAIALGTHLWGSWIAVLATPDLRAGLVAVIVLAALLATSFPSLTRRLKVRLWKQLHRLAYIAAILIFQHLMLSPFAPRRIVLVLFGSLLLLQALRFLPRPKPR